MTNENNKSIIENYEEFKSVIDLIIKDFEKFNIKNTKVAGVRVKSNLLICRKLGEVIENQIMEKVRNIPSKHRSDFTLSVLPEVLNTSVMSIENEVAKETPVEVKVRNPRRANKQKCLTLPTATV